jgi:hypothetical protein
MQREIPIGISNATNKPVFEFVKQASAHSDIAEVLMEAVKALGDVQLFCPDAS